MNYIVAIFARGGSKGLVDKNLMPLCGKPLIGWTIEFALNIPEISRVIVSTDSKKIASAAAAFGADVPFCRPDHLATDNSPEWLSWKHALEYLRDVEGYVPDAMVSLPATAPLRNETDVTRCLKRFEERDSDMVLTVTPSMRNPNFNMVSIDKNGFAKLAIQQTEPINRRQDAPSLFDITTVCYVADSNFVLNNNYFFDGTVKSVVVPRERSIDIDDRLDFKIAEMLMEERLSQITKDKNKSE